MSNDESDSVPDERRKAWGERYQPRYSGVATFMRRPLVENDDSWSDFDVGIIGVPFDGAVTNRPGARHGPRALRDESTLMGMVNHQTGVRPHEVYGQPTSAMSISKACMNSTALSQKSKPFTIGLHKRNSYR